MTKNVPAVTQHEFDGLPAWKLTSPTGAEALVAERGATLSSWRPRPEAEVIDGYKSAEELEAQTGDRSLVMLPWCGRIAEGTYSFGGARYKLAERAESAGLGGRAGGIDFGRVGRGPALVLRGRMPGDSGYPWNIDVTVVFALDAGINGEEHLSVSISAENASDSAAPLSMGWHPYIKMPGVRGISNLSLTIPARTKVLTDARIVPLPGDSAFAGVAAPVRFDYLGTTKIDQSYTNLVPDVDGVVCTELKDPVRSTRVRLTQEPSEAPVAHVFTGDGLPRDERQSIALEPCSALSDAFRRADSAVRLPLGPGETRTITATLTYIGG